MKQLVNDRGNVKWTALMMPEHINLLNQMWKEKEYKKKPVIDEQQMNEIYMKLQIAIHNDLNVIIEYYKDYDFHETKGKLKSVDSLGKFLQFSDSSLTTIPLGDILDVHID